MVRFARGLKKSLWILCLCLNVPNVTFLILSQTLPSNIYLIGTIVTFEKLGWGIGCVGHMIYMMQQIAPGPYKTAHYTFATALMGACMMSMGAISGYLQYVGRLPVVFHHRAFCRGAIHSCDAFGAVPSSGFRRPERRDNIGRLKTIKSFSSR